MQGEYGPLSYFPFALRTFDAIFLAALALNNSIDELGKMNLSLGDFDFDDYKKSSIFANVIRKHIRKLSFQGMMVTLYMHIVSLVLSSKALTRFSPYRSLFHKLCIPSRNTLAFKKGVLVILHNQS